MFKRNEYKLLNQMLDDAISGDFRESRFDESELSRLQSKLMRYLSSAAMSERKLQEEKTRIEELITNISHQTKTPLTNIMMYSQLLEETVPAGPAEEYAEEICLQSKKLDELIKALVKMSRLETGIFQFQKKETTLMEIVRNASFQATPRAKEKDIRITIMQDNDASVMIDTKWVTEAVFNIIDNAVKYSSEGSEICISVFSYELFSGIRVSDQGIGISEDETPKIFSRFYRGKGVHDKEGIGVGLYLARQIIEDHDGYIKVNSREGYGSTFDICLPKLRMEGVFRICLTFAFVLTIGMLLNHLLVNLIAGKMMMFRYKFVIWPALVCIPVFMAIAAAVPGMVMKQSFQTK